MNQKNTAKLAKQLNLPIVKVMVRGGTDHRKDLCLEDGSIVSLFRDGSTEKDAYKWR